MIGPKLGIATATILLSACALSGPQGAVESDDGRRQVRLIPHESGASMRTVVYRPEGAGPFPLALINHGSAEDPIARSEMNDPDYPGLAEMLVRRGFVVAIPQRPGHGRTGGLYPESAGSCESPDFVRAAIATARSIEIALEAVRSQPFVQNGPVLLIGHSAGGWGSLALAGTRPDAVGALIVFAAGRGGRSSGIANKNCAPDRLISAARALGQKAHAPSLWLYAENDTYFSSKLGRQLAKAYEEGGSNVTFITTPTQAEDGHFLIHQTQAVDILVSHLPTLLKRAGLEKQSNRNRR